MITRESDAWDYVRFGGSESWEIIARDSETGLYGFARLERDDQSGEEEIVGFKPSTILTAGIETGEFNMTTREWVD